MYFFILFIIIWGDITSFFIGITSQSFNVIHNMRYGEIVVGDMNADGLWDVMLSGQSSQLNFNFFLYKQNASLKFFDVTNGVTFPGGLPTGVIAGQLIFVDINRDGRMDLFYVGSGAAGSGVSSLYIQSNVSSSSSSPVFYNGSSSAFPLGLPQASTSYADFGDYDNNNALDLLLIGGNIPFFLFSQNASQTTFANVASNSSFPTGLPAPNMSNSWTAWRDFDRDGKLDFVLIGNNSNYLFRQNATGVFYNV